MLLLLNGSYHKLMLGYNSHNGFYDVKEVCSGLKKLVENGYGITLPDLEEWYLQRIDIAICFDLCDNQKVIRYIDNLRKCDYPRREGKAKDYRFGLEYPGQVSTLKIYNKLLEFRVHDISKLRKTDFNLEEYCNFVKGLVRFEVEIKKRKLSDLYRKIYCKEVRNLKVLDFNYNDLKEVWKCEFMKLLKMYDSELKIVSEEESVKERLITLYGQVRGDRLFDFFMRLKVQGRDVVKKDVSKSKYYRNVSFLSSAGVDFSQKYDIDLSNEIIDFNPFEWKEVI